MTTSNLEGQKSTPQALTTQAIDQQVGAKAVANTLATRVLQQLLNASTGVIAARGLLPSGRGQLSAMILWSLFLAGLTTFGLPASVIYYSRKQPHRLSEFAFGSLVMGASGGTVAMLIAMYFLPSWLHQYPSWVSNNARWFLLLTPVCSMSLVGRAVLEASGRFKQSNVQQLLVPLLTIGGLLAAVLTKHLTVTTAAIAYTLPALPAFWVLMRQMKPILDGRWVSITRNTSSVLLGYGLRSWGIDLLGTLGGQVDQVLVIRLLSPAEMGSYAVTLSLSRVMSIIQSSAVTVLFPKAAGKSAVEVVAMTSRAVRVSLELTLATSVVLALAGPSLLHLLYGREYIQSARTFQILLLEVTISGAAFLMSQAFMALGRPGVVTVLQAFGLAVSLPLMFLLIPRYGVFGAALALTLSTITRAILVFVAFRPLLHVSPPSLFPQLGDLSYILGLIRRQPQTQDPIYDV